MLEGVQAAGRIIHSVQVAEDLRLSTAVNMLMIGIPLLPPDGAPAGLHGPPAFPVRQITQPLEPRYDPSRQHPFVPACLRTREPLVFRP